MDNCFPISPASCGSPYSDVTSGSVYSDTVGPVSPDYSIDNLQAQFSVQSSASSASSDIPAEDSVPEENKRALAEYVFYQSLVVGSPAAVQAHLEHLISKYNVGLLGLPARNSTPGSTTPYSDIAQPKKRNKTGGVKRPMNAFMCFAKAERGHLMAGQPELHNARISQHLGDVWKLCPEALKSPYIDMAQWLKELHRQEHPEYKYRPRKRKASGNNNNNEKKTNNNVTAPVSDAAAAAACQDLVAEGPAKPAKRARKSGTKPARSRATRKPSGQAAQLVPSSTLVVKAPVVVSADCNANTVLAPAAELKVASATAASVLTSVPVMTLTPQLGSVAMEQQQHPSALTTTTEDVWHGSAALVPGHDNVDLSMFDPVDQEYLMQSLDSSMPGFLSDQYGFNVSSDKLLQGPQVEAALDGFSGDVDLASLLI